MASSEHTIVIKNVNPDLKRELENISGNQGIPLSSFLKPKLREIRDSFPPEMRAKKNLD